MERALQVLSLMYAAGSTWPPASTGLKDCVLYFCADGANYAETQPDRKQFL